jgi:RNAse (barnase) inhibitor barstar
VRFIGIDARSVRDDSTLEENWEALWKRSDEYMPALDAMKDEYGTEVSAPCSMMHHNGNDVDSENHFLAGRFFKADTPVRV